MLRPRWKRPLCFVLTMAASCALVAPRAAFAEPVTPAQLAQKLFDEARALLEHGEVTRACPMFAESQRLDPGGGTLLNLAVCHEAEGKLGAAYYELDEALALALRDRRADREAIAREHLSAVERRVPKLLVDARVSAPVTVALDDVALSAAALGSPVAVDPGAHVLRASAPGRRPWRWDGALREGEEARVVVPPLAPDLAVTPLLASADETASARKRRMSPASWVFFGVAGLSLATATATGAIALGKQSAFEGECYAARAYCPSESGAENATAARNFAWISTAALGVAAVSAIVALLWPRREAAAPAP